MLEKNPVIFIILAFVVIMVGTVVTMIAPFKWINGPGDRIAGVTPYSPLQQEGPCASLCQWQPRLKG